VARLNSKVTRGASIVLDDLQKGRIRQLEERELLGLHRRSKVSMVSPNSSLLSYYFGVKEVEEKPAPKIVSPLPEQRSMEKRTPPLNIDQVLKQLKRDLPVKDIMTWAIERYPEHSTSKILDIVLLAYAHSGFSVERGARQTYQTTSHLIEGPSLAVEHTHV